MTTLREGPRYGVDGYPFLVGLLVGGAAIAAAGVALWLTGYPVAARVAAAVTILPLVPATLGLHYVLRGKFHHRDRMLDAVAWRGDEVVLDVGTGAGLMMIGAAKRAPQGRCIGVDIWRAGDLSENGEARARRNAELEGVAGRIEIREEDARALTVEKASVDVVLSTLCLHNIEQGREQALANISAVVRPGGVVVISDLAHVDEYRRHLAANGFSVTLHGPAVGTFPPQRWLVARKA